MENVSDYLHTLRSPWGRMFYDLLFFQLNIPETPRLNILDFGSGLGVSARHYGAWHAVTAIEPNKEMIDNRVGGPGFRYTQLVGGEDKIACFPDRFFDVVFCHNVLEYIENKEAAMVKLFRVIKKGGVFSLVKHNAAGKVFQSAVFQNDPKKALAFFDGEAGDTGGCLGDQMLYSSEDAARWAHGCGGRIEKVLGMRAFWGLGQDNAVKYTEGWYREMFALECRAADAEAFRNAAFYHHFLIRAGG